MDGNTPPGGVFAARAARATSALVAMLLVAASCGIVEPDVQADGAVRFDPIEGGCWLIDAQGSTYLPLELDEEFKVDGLRIRFEATPQSDMASFCPGIIVRLNFIEAAD